jgi:crotonobetainyl-CoA:carnitine CoA-transferase CaiB-like acyl-CoA transferase
VTGTDATGRDQSTPGPLDGIRVIDVGVLVQGPQAAQMLYELGAEVIKVELPGVGDHARWVTLAPDDRRAPYFVACNRGKRGMTVDLRTDAGRGIFLDLARTADVVVSNFAAGTMDGWGLGHDDLAAANPRVVVAAGTSYGTEGDAADRKGADLGAQAAGGLARAMADGDTRPSSVAVTIADHIASQNIVSGVLAALIARERTGRGQRIDTSLLGGQIYAQASEFTATAMTGDDVPSPRHGGHPLVRGIYGIVPTADGAIALVGVVPEVRDEFFALIGAPELSADERFARSVPSASDRDALFTALGQAMRSRTTAEWGALFGNSDIRWAPVRHRSEVIADPASYDNGWLYRTTHPESGDVTFVGNPIRLSDTPVRHGGDVPELGQHTEEILLELGRSWDDIGALRESGAI